MAAALCFAASACVTYRVYPEEELAAVARRCGLAQGEVFQDPEEPRFLFLFAVAPSPEELGCVRRWSRRRHMHLAYIDSVQWSDE